MESRVFYKPETVWFRESTTHKENDKEIKQEPCISQEREEMSPVIDGKMLVKNELELFSEEEPFVQNENEIKIKLEPLISLEGDEMPPVIEENIIIKQELELFSEEEPFVQNENEMKIKQEPLISLKGDEILPVDNAGEERKDLEDPLDCIEEANMTFLLHSTHKKRTEIHSKVGPNKKRSRAVVAKKYSCTICGKIFSNKGNVKRHSVRDHGEEALKCSVCGKGFAFESDLRCHEGMHDNLSCPDCGSTFKRRSGLMQHMNIGSRDKQYSCDLCHIKFRYRCSFIRHAKVHVK